MGNLTKIWKGPCYTCQVEKDATGDYHVGGVSIKATEQLAFNQIADKLLDDNFVHHICVNLSTYENQNLIENLKIFPDWLNCFYIDGDNKYNCLRYKGLSDSIFIKSDHQNINVGEVVLALLSLKFPRNLFSEYIQNIIDCNDDTKRDIVVQDNFNGAFNTEFYFRDENDKYVLVKKEKTF